MTRRCSHCGNNGHNSRTCPTRGGGVKLFGVRLTDGSIIKKSASMGNLSAPHYHSSSSSAAASPNPGSPSSDPFREPLLPRDGYVSDDPAHATYSSSRPTERKKGIPWTVEEHRLFLLGLQKLGKGDWRGISRNFVKSRTATQVASHAQKYFIRQVNSSRRKRRSSLFDMVPNTVMDTPPLPEDHFMLPLTRAVESETPNSLLSLNLSLKPEFQPTEITTLELVEETRETSAPSGETPPVVTFFPAFNPLPFSLWPSNGAEEEEAETSHHQVLKPIPMLPKEPVNVDELVGMSQLSLREYESNHREPSPLSLKLLGPSSRQSAFHASTPIGASSDIKGKSNAIQAV